MSQDQPQSRHYATMGAHWLGDTYIEAEHLAYNTSTGAHSRSHRHGMVRYPNGHILACIIGVPDTYFTIPAHGKIKGKYVSGYVSIDTDANHGRGEYIFTILSNRSN